MKKYRFVLALLCVSFLFVLIPATAKAGLWEIPIDLNPGDTFRWVFVTSRGTEAFSRDIDYYNTFVDDVADAANGPTTNLAGIDNWADIQWWAIGSTPDDWAIENIGTTESNIYDLYGGTVASGTLNLWSGAIMSPIRYDEWGRTGDPVVWTGTEINGMARNPLGQEWVATGQSWSCSSSWIFHVNRRTEDSYPMYAISEELTVVPVPVALILAATGMLSATVGLKRLRRKHQE